MLDIPKEICLLLPMLKSADRNIRHHAYNLLGRILERHGMRWDYFAF